MAGISHFSVRKALLPALTAGFLLLPILAAGQAPVIAHQVDIFFGVDNHTVQITDNLVVPAGLEHLRLGDGLHVEIIKGSDGTSAVPGQSVAPAEDEDGPFQLLDLAKLGLAAEGGSLTIVYKG